MCQNRGKFATKEDVVAQNQTDRVAANELLADQKGLGQTLGGRLHLVADIQTEMGAVSEELLKIRQVVGGRDKQYVSDAGQHQHIGLS